MWRLLQRVSDLERRIGAVYARLAECFRDRPPVAAFWRDLAAEEEIHGLIIAAAREVFPATSPPPDGDWAAALDRIEERLEEISREIAEGIGIEEAFSRAEELESSELGTITSMLIDHAGERFSRLAPLVTEWRLDQHSDRIVVARKRYCSGWEGRER